MDEPTWCTEWSPPATTSPSPWTARQIWPEMFKMTIQSQSSKKNKLMYNPNFNHFLWNYVPKALKLHKNTQVWVSKTKLNYKGNGQHSPGVGQATALAKVSLTHFAFVLVDKAVFTFGDALSFFCIKTREKSPLTRSITNQYISNNQ